MTRLASQPITPPTNSHTITFIIETPVEMIVVEALVIRAAYQSRSVAALDCPVTTSADQEDETAGDQTPRTKSSHLHKSGDGLQTPPSVNLSKAYEITSTRQCTRIDECSMFASTQMAICP